MVAGRWCDAARAARTIPSSLPNAVQGVRVPCVVKAGGIGMGVHGRLESIPSALESAYRDRDNSKSIVMVPSKRVLDQKVIEG
ncbi:Uncharacterised protein [Mycobacteroides abscessus subsp. bolletii]|uniref:Uncharacterized protein n=2 Tax=Mycobacteroides abscessus TaxID=36809 RepID=A0A9Q7WIA6_9MYCO|nr:Uncharacterised protein [Mycobacteroides abscessus subsp. bolletii]